MLFRKHNLVSAVFEMLKAYRLSEFLKSKPKSVSDIPPLVHSTQAKNFYKILETHKLLATPCNIFRGEKLCYLFVGRPAYKWSTRGEASYWQLPLIFVMSGFSDLSIKRIHPFDTGAFSKSTLPDYLTTFEMSSFELGTNPEIIGSYLHVFFKDSDRYYLGQAVGEEELKTDHNLGPRHQEIQALARLNVEKSNRRFDDRARAIELQIASDVNLTAGNLLGVVLPEIYMTDVDTSSAVRKLNCDIETYEIYPLAVEAYYQQVYSAVRRIIRKAGL